MVMDITVVMIIGVHLLLLLELLGLLVLHTLTNNFEVS